MTEAIAIFWFYADRKAQNTVIEVDSVVLHAPWSDRMVIDIETENEKPCHAITLRKKRENGNLMVRGKGTSANCSNFSLSALQVFVLFAGITHNGMQAFLRLKNIIYTRKASTWYSNPTEC